MPKVVRKMPQKPRLEQPKKVAAYARVSTGKDAMLHSLSSQVSYYSSLIQNHAGWLYVGVYSDEALTGTKDSRGGFQNLLADCRAGKVNLILTKSISRFARNTVTLLQTVRELKSLGVDIFFEEQNIHTISAEGELMLTILASYAQEESLSASENQKWRVRKGFEKGELVNLRFLFGYCISKDKIQIGPETAPIVREIFNRVIAGESLGSISRDLNTRGYSGALGGKWCVQRIREIVENEKYTGNAMLQKHYRNNHLEKKKCRNTGELPKYYAEDTHPAIIDKDTFEAAQAVMLEMENMHKNKPRPKTREFTGLIYCPHCEKNYKRIIYKGSVGWNCSTYVSQGKAYCHGKKIPEDTLKTACADALGILEFDAAVFSERIDRIEVPGDNLLLFVFKDGRTEERTWSDKSRRDSWTAEMKQAAAERTRQRRKSNGKSKDDSGDEK
ncbi:MAG: recombinase family protein [Eubacteriales bacterium]|nr:recombinase family protein [Eubacteriales bacterium]